MKKKSRAGSNNNNTKSSVRGGSKFGGRNGNGGGGRKNSKRAASWDQVPIDEEFLGEDEMQNIISLEVLSDYEIVKRPDGLTDIVTGADKLKNLKRKALDDEGDEDGDGPAFESGEDEMVEEFGDSPKKKVKLQKGEAVQVKATKNLKKMGKDDGNVAATTSNWTVVPSPNTYDPEQGNGNGSVNSKSGRESKNAKKDSKMKTNANVKDKKEQKEKKEQRARPERPVKPMLPKGVNAMKLGPPEPEPTMEEWIKAGVPDTIIRALKEAGFSKPTSIQSLTLPASILGKKDVVGAAETGSGKTLAFAIPIIHGILQGRNKVSDDNKAKPDHSLQALILTPTRELAVQIKKHFDIAARYARIKTVVIVGGLATVKQERLLRWKPHVVIATPGRLWELAREGDPHLAALDKIKYLAVDETDRMVERGHFQELENILGVVNKDLALKEQRQNFVFSATLAFTHEPPQRLSHGNKKFKKPPKKLTTKDKLRQIMELIGVRPNPKIVDITNTKGTCENLTEMQINCPLNQKDAYMYYFFKQHPGRTIVFCNSINCVRRLTNLFFLLKCGEVLPLHSEMFQKQRLRNLERFADNELGILIATDVAARGLDIVNIQHVIHYEVPKTAESYIHRSGRTARAFKGGLALVLVEPAESSTLRNIFRSLNRDENQMLPLFQLDNSIFKQLKTRVDEAVKVEQFEHMVRKKLADMNWMDKAKKDMDLASSDDDSDTNDNGERRAKKNVLEAKKKLDSYKKKLNDLLDDESIFKKTITA